MDLQDRSVLLTGAGSGIGRALALELAARSARITLVGRRSEPLEEVAALVRERGGQAHVAALDLTGPGAPAAAVAAAQEQFGGVDVLVNNAGNVRAGRLEALVESEVLAQIALNLAAPILLTRAAVPALRASGDGLVVNASSGIGLIGMPFYSTYAATKAGIAHSGEALRRELYGEGVHVLNVYPGEALRRELYGEGVHVLNVYPGATSTPMMDSSHAGAEHGFEYESPEDVAAAVAGMEQGALTVVRGGATRSAMITLNREDPAAVDRMLFERKSALEEAVADHSSL